MRDSDYNVDTDVEHMSMDEAKANLVLNVSKQMRARADIISMALENGNVALAWHVLMDIANETMPDPSLILKVERGEAIHIPSLMEALTMLDPDAMVHYQMARVVYTPGNYIDAIHEQFLDALVDRGIDVGPRD